MDTRLINILLIMGGATVGLLIMLAFLLKRTLSYPQKVTAKIVSIKKKRHRYSNKDSEYFPVYGYEFEGVRYHFTSRKGSTEKPQMGAVVQIRIKPKQPDECVELFPIKFFLIGYAAIIVVMLILFFIMR